jgi:predicted enzyme related to lactoylglutathione lyase
MGNPVVHFEVLGKNGHALQDFYKQAFDWRFELPAPGVNVPDYTLVTPEAEAGIRGGIGSSPEGHNGHVTFYVGVPGIEAAFDKIEKLGGKRMMGPNSVPGGGPTIGYFTDPEGHVIGLVQV